MWSPPDKFFDVTPLVVTPWPMSNVAYRNDPEKKKLFGIELAKGLKPFEAGLKVFGEDTGAALWVSQNWTNDPIVLEAQSEQVVKLPSKLLDKDQLAIKVLQFADERDQSGRFYINEDRVRLASFELYAKIQGFIGKTEVTNNNSFTNNVMKIELVAPDEKEQPQIKTIEHDESDIVDLPTVQLVEAS